IVLVAAVSSSVVVHGQQKVGSPAASSRTARVSVAPDKMPRIATVDERYQSYNIEMVELTGGQFWRPYEQIAAASKPKAAAGRRPQGRSPGAAAGASSQAQGAEFYARQKGPLQPIDLANPRLRKLAAALGPAYVRSSGN